MNPHQRLAKSRQQTGPKKVDSKSRVIQENRVEKILDKKTFNGKTYYKLCWFDVESFTWESAEDCVSCKRLIEEFERNVRTGRIVLDNSLDNEWEVQAIKNKRVFQDRVQYLVEWKGWPGADTWEYADDCTCHNLIAGYENPKLSKLWNFNGSIPKLWLSQEQMLKYMRNYLQRNNIKDVSLLKFRSNFPLSEKPLTLREGVNIGPLLYENHWYLVIIIINFLNVTKRILVGDSLNTLVGTKIKFHPVVKRFSRVYRGYPIKPFRMTQMERSDVCAYYTLAAFERALALYNEDAPFIVENVFFSESRTELIRSQTNPESDGLISISLPIPDINSEGPMCEFCEKTYTTRLKLEDHINRRHRNKGTSRQSSPSPSTSTSD